MKILVLLLLSFSTFGASVINRQNYTFSPKIQVTGPVYNKVSRTEYHQQIFRIILEEAQVLAQDYIDAKDYSGYWSFMMGSLVIPYHESRNTHVREVQNGKGICREKSNSGKILATLTSSKFVFDTAFKNKKSPIFPSCTSLVKEPLLTQIIHGHDGTDIGLMQVNIRWHEKGYVAAGSYKDVRETVKYGLTIFKKGFEAVYRNPKRHSCILNKGRINQKKLIHAAWSGIYNSGEAIDSCRWIRKDNKWQANDEAFVVSVKGFYALNEKKKLSASYPLPKTEAALLKTMIEKAAVGTENEKIITDYLATTLSFSPEDEVKTEKELRQEFRDNLKTNGKVEAITSGAVNVRATAPNGTVLGAFTGTKLNDKTPVTIVEIADRGKESWYKISSPMDGWIHSKNVDL